MEIMNVNGAANTAMIAANTQKAIAEVQAAMILARQFPRDEVRVLDKIENAFSRQSLADASTYVYARGGTNITGASIRAAEAIAQLWGNCKFGFNELSRGTANGISYSEVEAFAWDIETNARREVKFRVPHVRDTKGGRKLLTDERDIYEMIANQAQRRVRACIMAVIPGDVFDKALETARKKTTANVDMSPDAMQKVLSAFEKLGITKERIEARFQRKFSALEPGQVVILRNIWTSIKDGIGSADDHFPILEESTEKAETKTASVREKIKQRKETADKTVDTETGEIALTFAEVNEKIIKAKTLDELYEAQSLVRFVADEHQRNELHDAAEMQKNKLGA